MKKVNKVLSATMMAAAVFATGAIGVSAAEGGSTIKITTEATTMNVTVPSEMPMTFKADGSNVYADNFTIENNSSIGDIHLSSIEAEGVSDWTLQPEGTDFNSKPANTKSIELTVQGKVIAPEGGTEAATGSATYTQGEFDVANQSGATMTYSAKRGAFTDVLSGESAYTLTMTFDFNE